MPPTKIQAKLLSRLWWEKRSVLEKLWSCTRHTRCQNQRSPLWY